MHTFTILIDCVRNNACERYVSYIDDKNKLINNNSCRLKVEFDF